jgi:2-polyprenyl-6-methoxyphenol hydroxylase-like FAD-dependent oxidoreductase
VIKGQKMTAEIPILIIGAGPVGLSLAAELGQTGKRCIVVEERTEVTNHPKATLLGSRSMEFFRRWGIVDKVLDAGLPLDNTYDVIFCTKLRGWELSRYKTPSMRDILGRSPEAIARLREMAWSPYFKTQIGQQALEPVLAEFAKSFTTNDIRYGWSFESFEQDSTGVTAKVVEIATGKEETIRAQFLVGCDGGSSKVRKQLGYRYVGRGAMRPNVSFFFRSDEFLKKHDLGHGNLYFIFSPESFGVFTAINGKDLWNYQYYFLDPSKATRDVNPKEVLSRAMGTEFKFELLNIMHWNHHQSVAEKYRNGRVFLAGDSAHLFSPTGGVGMNTGIGDAVDLAWKLTAVLDGWGGPYLLDSYEQERKPIGVRNTMTTAQNADRIDMVMKETTPEVEEDSARGAMLRRELARKLKWMSRQFNTAGLHLGYRYVDSPIIVADGSPEPPDDTQQVSPSTWPGMRAPHAWMADGHTTLDLFEGRYTLLRVGPSAPDGAELVNAARSAGIPIDVKSIDEPEINRLYERALVLVRPDGHVAWRGDQMPADPRQVVERIRGAISIDS